MKEIKEILNLPLGNALQKAKEIRTKNFKGMKRIQLVNGYLLGPRCGADCKFCGWNRNIEPAEERKKLNKQMLRGEIGISQRINSTIEIINNTIKITHGLMRELEKLAWGCDKRPMGLSIGLCDNVEYFQALKDMGWQYYVNDLETSPRIFPSIVSTHYWKDKLISMQRCREAGLRLRSGFILGFGENNEDLATIFKTLKDFQVEGIVINFFMQAHGVYLKSKSLTPEGVLRRLAQLRIIFPRTQLILGGGRRRWLGEDLVKEAFLIVDTIYVRRFLNHINPYWLKEGEIITNLELNYKGGDK